jgi:inositol-phosphate phosphatase/L-galactose 1-phosphate phosphatase/histidinol-phosphatase
MSADGARAGAAERFVDLALRMADAARPIARRYFRASEQGLSFKDNGTPVTAADQEIEESIRATIAREVPDHGIFGEEHGSLRTDADFVWVVDPIDGTKSFTTGKPLWGVLIALTLKGKPVIGIIDQPFMDERWLGVEGRPTTFNHQPVKTRACAALGDAWLYATTPDMFRGAEGEAYARLRGDIRHAIYGADCYAYGLLANGYVDLVCEADLKPYDYCALVPVIEGAGGTITDWEGRPLGLNSGARVLAAGDPALHAKARARLIG